jgi:hypothetical protein
MASFAFPGIPALGENKQCPGSAYGLIGSGLVRSGRSVEHPLDDATEKSGQGAETYGSLVSCLARFCETLLRCILFGQGFATASSTTFDGGTSCPVCELDLYFAQDANVAFDRRSSEGELL